MLALKSNFFEHLGAIYTFVGWRKFRHALHATAPVGQNRRFRGGIVSSDSVGAIVPSAATARGEVAVGDHVLPSGDGVPPTAGGGVVVGDPRRATASRRRPTPPRRLRPPRRPPCLPPRPKRSATRARSAMSGGWPAPTASGRSWDPPKAFPPGSTRRRRSSAPPGGTRPRRDSADRGRSPRRGRRRPTRRTSGRRGPSRPPPSGPPPSRPSLKSLLPPSGRRRRGRL